MSSGTTYLARHHSAGDSDRIAVTGPWANVGGVVGLGGGASRQQVNGVQGRPIYHSHPPMAA